MRTVIAGSRTFNDDLLMRGILENLPFYITKVISGCAKGADRMGELWANDFNIPIERFPANWDEMGKRAGYVRNAHMIDTGGAEAVIAFWDGESKGTKHLINLALDRKILLIVVPFKKENNANT